MYYLQSKLPDPGDLEVSKKSWFENVIHKNIALKKTEKIHRSGVWLLKHKKRPSSKGTFPSRTIPGHHPQIYKKETGIIKRKLKLKTTMLPKQFLKCLFLFFFLLISNDDLFSRDALLQLSFPHKRI